MSGIATMRLTAVLLAWVPVASVHTDATAAAAPERPRKPISAQSYIESADVDLRARNYRPALAKLRLAEQLLVGEPLQTDVRFKIARCLEELRLPVEADAAYERYLAGQAATTSSPTLKVAAFGRLVVECAPTGVELTLKAPSAAGENAIEAETLDCPVDRQVHAGAYALVARRKGYLASGRTVVVGEGQIRQESILLHPARGLKASAESEVRGPWPWILIGGSAAVLATGVALHVGAASKRDEANGAPYGKERDSLTRDYERLQVGAFVAYGVAALAAAAGTYIILLRSGANGSQPGLAVTQEGVGFVW